MTHQCPYCHQTFTAQNAAATVVCPNCGKSHNPDYSDNNQGATPKDNQADYQSGFQQGYNAAMRQNPGIFDEGPSGHSRGVAAILAILLGTLGIQYFYMGKSTAGIIFIVCTICSCGILGAVTYVLSLVQGIYIFTLSQEEFERKYIYSTQTIPMF